MTYQSTYNLYNKFPSRDEEVTYFMHAINMEDRRLTDEYNGSIITDELGNHMPVNNFDSDVFKIMLNRQMQGGIRHGEMGYTYDLNNDMGIDRRHTDKQDPIPLGDMQDRVVRPDEMGYDQIHYLNKNVINKPLNHELRVLNNNQYSPITHQYDDYNDYYTPALHENIIKKYASNLESPSYGMKQPQLFSNFNAKKFVK